MSADNVQFDFIIVGAGSAGCVLANRLSRDQSKTVLLLEAGPENNALSLKMPAAVLTNLNSTKHNWAFQGEPEPQLNGRSFKHDRGKTLGGSSSINGMVFIRGHALDFENWRQCGCEGWSYADVLPYFKRLETYEGGANEYRGDSGPMKVHRPEPKDPISLAFLEAGAQAGHPLTDDICGFQQEGFGLLDSSVHKGTRWSSAVAFLDPARSRPNLTIRTHTQVQRVLFNENRASGVVFNDKDANIQTVNTNPGGEVILSAGAVGSPQLLMLSGVGPAAHLSEMGIDVVRDLPGVGQNLNDHPDFVLKFKCIEPVSIWPKTKLFARTLEGIRWLLKKDGVCASNHFDTVACLRTGPEVDHPDIQLTISPIAVDDKTWQPLPLHAFQIHVGLMQAYSRGEITLRSKNALDHPRILVNYLQDPRDLELLRKGIRIVRELVSQPAFGNLCGEEFYPGNEMQTDDELNQCLVEKTVSQWHLSGTARMGAVTDRAAVVDPAGKVHGMKGLRVVDASIMPVVTNGNTNCPTLMLAEKLSDVIMGKPPLPRIEAKVWSHSREDTSVSA